MTLDPVKYETFYQKLDKIVNEGKEVIRYLSSGTITREAGEVQEAAAEKFDRMISNGTENDRGNVSKPLAKAEEVESEPSGTRTQDSLIKSQVLCQLS